MENFEPTINFETKDEMFRYLCEHFFFNGNYEKAAEAGSASACDYLGYLYMSGSLVTQDTEKGLIWYRKAAELGNARSMYALGYAYQSGQGVDANIDEALRWYEKAALAGSRNAYLVWKTFK